MLFSRSKYILISSLLGVITAHALTYIDLGVFVSAIGRLQEVYAESHLLIYSIGGLIAFLTIPAFVRYVANYNDFVSRDGYRLCAHEFEVFQVFMLSASYSWLYFFAPMDVFEAVKDRGLFSSFFSFLQSGLPIFIVFSIVYFFVEGLPRRQQLPYTVFILLSINCSLFSLEALLSSAVSAEEKIFLGFSLFSSCVVALPWTFILWVLSLPSFIAKWFRIFQYSYSMFNNDPQYRVAILQKIKSIFPSFRQLLSGVGYFLIFLFTAPFRWLCRRGHKGLSEGASKKLSDAFDLWAHISGITDEDRMQRALLRSYRDVKKRPIPFLLHDGEYGGVDILERGFFVQGVVTNIKSYLDSFPSTEFLSIGLCGEWGSGKSYVVNAIFDELKKRSPRVICIKTFPWRYFLSNDDAAILRGFMADIEVSLFKSIRSLKIRRLFKVYIDLLSKGASSYSLGGLSFDFSFFGRDESFEKVGKAIQDELKYSDYKLIIAIEDLDRMSFDEIIKVIRLIRASIHFQNVVILLPYDKERVNDLLVKNFVSKEYLQKFIQVEFNLPPVKSSIIRDYLINEIKDRWLDAASVSAQKFLPTEKEITEAVEEIFDKKFISSSVQNLRQAKRLLNGVLLPYTSLHKEICLIEFIELEILKLNFPELYKDILTNTEYYLPKSLGHFDVSISHNQEGSLEEICSRHLKKVIDDSGYSGRKGKAAEDLIKDIFPHFDEDMFVSVVNNREYRIHESRYFLRYFEGRVSAEQIRNIQVFTVMDETFSGGSEESQKTIAHRNLSEMFYDEVLHDFLTLIYESSDDRVSSFSRIAFSIFCENESIYGADSVEGEPDFLIYHMRKCLANVDESEQASLADEAIRLLSLYRAVILVHYFSSDKKKKFKGINSTYVDNKKAWLIQKFEEEIINRKVNIFTDLPLKEASFLWYVFSLWMKDDLMLSKYLENCIGDNTAALNAFLDIYQSRNEFDNSYYEVTISKSIREVIERVSDYNLDYSVLLSGFLQKVPS